MVKRLIILAVSAVFYVIKKIGAVIASSIGKPVSPPFVVLKYHAVKADEVENFKKQMDYVLRAGKPAWADEQYSTINGCRKIAVTFDDAFQCVVVNALPVMRERGIPATIFVPAGYLGKTQSWWVIPSEESGDKEKVLEESELKAMGENHLVKVGSHGLMHQKLTQIAAEETNKELVESRRILHDITGKAVDLFSFPYGDCNDATVKMCMKAGYKRIFLADPLRRQISAKYQIVFGRIGVSLDDWTLEYRLKILGAYEWLGLAIQLKRKLILMGKEKPNRISTTS